MTLLPANYLTWCHSHENALNHPLTQPKNSSQHHKNIDHRTRKGTHSTFMVSHCAVHTIRDHNAATSCAWRAPSILYRLGAWFFSYISASVAFFGFSFYLIGRRESGFIRSFIYQRDAIRRFLIAHFCSYSIISVGYAFLFYLATKPLYGHYSLIELSRLLASFYTSYLFFTCIGLGIAALPIKFSTSSTLFSLMSFLMLISGYTGAVQGPATPHSLTLLNPLYLSTKLFNNELSLLNSFSAALVSALIALYLTGRYFRVQPIWSRY